MLPKEPWGQYGQHHDGSAGTRIGKFSPKVKASWPSLSNLATESLVTLTCRLSTRFLSRNKGRSPWPSQEDGTGQPTGSRWTPYRAATHNKGIFNGIDALVIATGNDWRAVEAGSHAYASKDGSYRGLSTWTL